MRTYWRDKNTSLILLGFGKFVLNEAADGCFTGGKFVLIAEADGCFAKG